MSDLLFSKQKYWCGGVRHIDTSMFKLEIDLEHQSKLSKSQFETFLSVASENIGLCATPVRNTKLFEIHRAFSFDIQQCCK